MVRRDDKWISRLLFRLLRSAGREKQGADGKYFAIASHRRSIVTMVTHWNYCKKIELMCLNKKCLGGR